MIRAGRDDDAAGYIRLIGACWSEYPGCVLDVDREVPELRALASHFAQASGKLWVVEGASGLLGMVGVRPLRDDAAWEVCRMYVAGEARGTGLAGALLETAETWAREAGAARIVLWTDTRFVRAHGFYEKRGYVRQGSIRILDDMSKSLEFRYTKPLAGLVVEALDAAAAASAERRLSEILIACVADGASVSYLRPLNPVAARGFWQRVSAGVARGQVVLLGAWLNGVFAGTVQLDLGTPENQQHRADLVKLLVDPAFRSRGIARALMQKAEQAARAHGRMLLTLDTVAGGPAEALYRRLGWREAGRIPGYAVNAHHDLCDTVIFWKRPV